MYSQLQELDPSGKVYNILFEQSPCPMWILEPGSLQVLAVNLAAVDFYGYDRTEFLAMTLIDIRAANDSSRSPGKSTGKPGDGFDDSGISSHRKKNGDVVYIQVYSKLVTINKTPVRLEMLIDQDARINQSRGFTELSEMVNIQKKRLDYILANIDDVVWGTWADTHELIFTNEACERVYGYTEEEMLADKGIFFNSIHIDDRPAFYDSSNQLLATGRADFEFRVLHRNGALKYLRGIATVMKGENGSPDICCGLNIDVTKERELLQKIENDEYKLRSLIDNTNDLIWSVDTTFNIVTVNQAFINRVLELTGKKPVIGGSIFSLGLNNETINKWRLHYERAAGGENFTVYERHILEGDEIRFADISFNPIRDKDGGLMGVSCFSRDIAGRITNIQAPGN